MASDRFGARPSGASAALPAPPRRSAYFAREAGVTDAIAYRLLRKGSGDLAANAPDLHDVMEKAHGPGVPFLCLDGTLVPTDRVAARVEANHDLWYSCKHHSHGGKVQLLADPGGSALWVSTLWRGRSTT